MDRINKIINHQLYKEYLNKIKKYEEGRIFCKHDMNHFLDVCRIAEIFWLKLQIKKLEEDDRLEEFFQSNNFRELIYATGLLHDIGRWQEYESGVSHEIASSKLAPQILEQCGFEPEEIEAIVLAILNHRNKNVKDLEDLSGLIYSADKKSRACFACEAEMLCDWSKEKKNLLLT